MVDAPSQLPEPSAQGTLAKTPFPHLLIYCLERQLSGTLELVGPNGDGATILVIDGQPTKARTTEPVAYLGRVMLELGFLTDDQYNHTLRLLAERKKLYGQIVLEEGLINEEQLELGLRSQLVRKMQHLVHLPPETTFRYYDSFDALHTYGGDGHVGIDPFPLIWAAIREEPPWEHVHVALTKLGSAGLHVLPDTETARFAFERSERATIDLLRTRPMRMHEITAAGTMQPRLVQLLVYCLLVTKQVELIRDSQLPPAPLTAQPPEGEASRSPDDTDPPPSPLTPVARVQLGKKEISKSRAIVEEAAPAFPYDERLTPPPMQAPVVPGTAYAASAARHGKTEGVPSAPGSVPGQAARSGTTKPGAGISPAAQAAMPGEGATVSANRAPPPPVTVVPSKVAAPAVKAAVQATVPVAGTLPLTPEQEKRRAEIVDRAATIDKQNYFEMLGIGRDSTPEQAQQAFFALAKVWHPDRVPPVLSGVREQCARVFSHMSEAHQTLTDAQKRQRYLTVLREGGATPESQAEILAVIEAATNFQKAEICLKRNDLAQAEALCKKAIEGDAQQADYHAMLAWLDSMKPDAQSPPRTEEMIARLDKAVVMNKMCERAYFYRGMLHKRLQKDDLAARDFKKASELNPRNIDAQREVRLYEMRRGGTPPPPGAKGPGAGTNKTGTRPPTQPSGGKGKDEGGLFGKLFKK